MVDKLLDTWVERMEAIQPSPGYDEVEKMYWGNEWRYYQYRGYSNKNGKIWFRITKKQYKDYLRENEKFQHLTFDDVLNNL